MKRVCKGMNRITHQPCRAWATIGVYCQPHAIRARIIKG